MFYKNAEKNLPLHTLCGKNKNGIKKKRKKNEEHTIRCGLTENIFMAPFHY